MILASNATGTAASMMFENTKPVRKSTLSSLTYFSASWRPTSGLNWSSPTSTSAGRPPSLPPFSLTASWKASRMSTPSAALGPDRVLTKPTLTLPAACAPVQNVHARARTTIRFFMEVPSLASILNWKQSCAALAALACTALAAPAAAQVGGKVLRIVVPFAAGGAREVLARTFYGELGAALGQTVIVENRPGAGGAIGTASVARAAPDGNTLVFAASSHNLTVLLAANPAYDPINDFAAVANVGMQSYVLMTSAQLPARTLGELVRHAKAHPGTLNYASAGHGSSSHLAMAYLARLAGIEMVHIPFKSTQDATNDVIAGRSHALIVPNVGAMPFQKDARIRLLGVTSPKRSAFLPEVPAVAEDLPGYVFESWFGLLAPARTPRAVIERINAEVAKLLRNPVILERLAAQGVEPRPLSPAAFEKLLREDHEAMARVVKSVGRVE